MGEVTIHLGWWMIPALVSAATLGWACWPKERSYGYYGADFAGAFILLVAIIGNLVVWLIWVLFA